MLFMPDSVPAASPRRFPAALKAPVLTVDVSLSGRQARFSGVQPHRRFFTISRKTVDKRARIEYNMKRCLQHFMRSWRNWHTRTFEGRVLNRVRVQVPSTAPKKDADIDMMSAFFIYQNTREGIAAVERFILSPGRTFKFLRHGAGRSVCPYSDPSRNLFPPASRPPTCAGGLPCPPACGFAAAAPFPGPCAADPPRR